MNEKMNSEPERRDHYDFTGGVWRKYVDRLKNAGQMIILEPDIAAVFATSESVNETPRGLLPVIKAQAAKLQHS